ncbi:MAG TPA: hypothetical protein VK177_13115 [Flavobacteriales bacterium]|nr:hypothetical protein [Flavobacteriales bacterium]
MLRHFLFFIFLLVQNKMLAAQEMYFNNEKIDTVRIVSHVAGYQFDSCGTTIGSKDVYMLVFNAKRGQYEVNSYKRTKYEATFKCGYKEDIYDAFKNRNAAAFDPSVSFRLKKLIADLDTGSLLPAMHNSGISKTRFEELTSKYAIGNMLRKSGLEKKVKKHFATKSATDSLVKSIQNVDTFNLYLQTKFGDCSNTMITDACGVISIYIHTFKEIYRFEGEFQDEWFQPWQLYRKNEWEKDIVNLKINIDLSYILPHGFKQAEALSDTVLIKSYMKWMLVRLHLLQEY